MRRRQRQNNYVLCKRGRNNIASFFRLCCTPRRLQHAGVHRIDSDLSVAARGVARSVSSVNAMIAPGDRLVDEPLQSIAVNVVRNASECYLPDLLARAY